MLPFVIQELPDCIILYSTRKKIYTFFPLDEVKRIYKFISYIQNTFKSTTLLLLVVVLYQIT